MSRECKYTFIDIYFVLSVICNYLHCIDMNILIILLWSLYKYIFIISFKCILMISYGNHWGKTGYSHNHPTVKLKVDHEFMKREEPYPRKHLFLFVLFYTCDLYFIHFGAKINYLLIMTHASHVDRQFTEILFQRCRDTQQNKHIAENQTYLLVLHYKLFYIIINFILTIIFNNYTETYTW